MKNINIKNIGMVIAMTIVLSSLGMAEEIKAVNNSAVISDTVKLINIAGKQRMLSQRIAKAYLYAGKNVSTAKAKKELKASVLELQKSHKILVSQINDSEIKNLLVFVEMSTEDFQETSMQKFSVDNAQLILDLSESMLEGSQYVVNSLKDKVKANESVLVGLSGKQRMLSQRIAKYYIAYQIGIKDKNTINQMNDAVKSFQKAHELLMQNKTNSPAINRKLNDIDRLWKVVYKFYLGIEKGGLPLIVFNTTNNITLKMNEITKLYVELSK